MTPDDTPRTSCLAVFGCLCFAAVFGFGIVLFLAVLPGITVPL